MPRVRRTDPSATFGGVPTQHDASDPLTVRAMARLMLVQQEALTKYGAGGDPWLFCRDLVHTQDEATMRVRKFPDRTYLELLCARWREHRLLAVPKSRRMVVTWLFVALNYWLARFHPHSKIAFMARKAGVNEEEGSAELVKRAFFIHEHLPPIFPALRADYHVGRLTFENGSVILGLGEGADQARQHTFSAVLADEIGFWEQAWETWVALKPTVEGGGRITCVSSASTGFWRQLVMDQL